MNWSLVNDGLLEDYFEWLCSKLEPAFNWRAYSKLMRRLFEIDFVWTNEMDENRGLKGLYLRDAYGAYCGFSEDFVANEIDICPCSILEMMVALALDCEEKVMWNENMGDRTGVWFYHMLENLGLLVMQNPRYNQKYTDHVIDIFLRRRYQPNGKGSLFVTSRTDVDMRMIDIWYQMMYWLADYAPQEV